jgi:hypothetical protein
MIFQLNFFVSHKALKCVLVSAKVLAMVALLFLVVNLVVSLIGVRRSRMRLVLFPYVSL